MFKSRRISFPWCHFRYISSLLNSVLVAINALANEAIYSNLLLESSLRTNGSSFLWKERDMSSNIINHLNPLILLLITNI